MTGDNSDTTLTLSVTPTNENHVNVYWDGVYQHKDNWALSGTTITFATAPGTGVKVEAVSNQMMSAGTATDLTASAISSKTLVTAIGADHLLVYDATDGALKKALISDITIDEASNITAVANNSADETVYPTFVDGATGTQGIETDTGLTYNPSSGNLTTAGQLGAATLSLSGNATVGGNLTVTGTTTQVNTVTMNAQNAVVFEGATADNYETTLSIVDPTADHTQYLLNQTGYIPLLAAATTTTISATPAELNLLDGSTANSVVNSKAVIYGSSGELAGALSTAAQPAVTSLGTLTTLTVDDITINSSTISDGSDLTFDVGGNFIVDADGGGIYFKDGGTLIGSLQNSSSDFVIANEVNDEDIIFKGIDGNSTITALTLDMSDGGAAHFVQDIYMVDNAVLRLGTGQDFRLYHDGNHSTIHSTLSNGDILIKGVDDGSTITALTLDMSSAGAATFNSTVNATGLTVGNSNIGSNTSHLANLTINNNSYIGSVGNTSAIKIATSGAVTMGYADLTITADNARLLVEEADGTNIAWVGDHTGDGHGGLLLYNHGGTATVKLTADSHANYINNGNNFGIGVASPSSIFDVRGSGDVSIQSKLINTGQTTAGRETEFLFGKDNGANLSAVLKYYYHTTQANRRIDLFHYGTTNGLSVLNGGNVGIGTTSPSNPLSVSGVITSGNFTSVGVGGTPGDANTAELGPGYLNLARDDTADAKQILFGKNGAVHSYLETTSSGLNIGGGNVGIGTAAPNSQLTVGDTGQSSTESQILTSTSGAGYLYFGDGTSGAARYAGYIGYYHNGDYMTLNTAAVPRIRLDADGLKFNADTAAANALDDYEEGTWVPLMGGWSSATRKSAGSTNAGRYTKIGDMCTVFGTMHWNGSETIAGGILVSGLPFTAVGSGVRAAGALGGTSGVAGSPAATYPGLRLTLDPGNAFFYLIEASSSGYDHSPTISNEGHIYGISFTYKCA
jgi:hypothetical protein